MDDDREHSGDDQNGIRQDFEETDSAEHFSSSKEDFEMN